MTDITKNFHYKSLEQALYHLSTIFRREYLDEVVHTVMNNVFTESYRKPVEHEADTSDEENPTPEPLKRPRGRPRKN